MIKNGNIILSQSMTKELGFLVIDDQVEETVSCPKRFYHKYISEDYGSFDTQSMLEGRFAETLLLGSGARGDVTDDLPRKGKGEKRVSQIRIERQMDRLYGYMYAHGIRFNPLFQQVRLIAKFADKIWLTGEYDMFPVIVDGHNAIVDVKTTKDIYNTFFSIDKRWVRGSSNSCWGTYDQIAKNQPLFYHHIARNFQRLSLDDMIRYNKDYEAKYRAIYALKNDYSDINFWFYVAGVGKADFDDQLARYEYAWTRERELLLETLVFSSVEKVREFMADEFRAIPEKTLCGSCALKDVCIEAIKSELPIC